MSKYGIIFDGELQDCTFDSEDSAEEYALYLCGCSRQGAEDLNLSNPGDYTLDYYEDPDFEIVALDDEETSSIDDCDNKFTSLATKMLLGACFLVGAGFVKAVKLGLRVIKRN